MNVAASRASLGSMLRGGSTGMSAPMFWPADLPTYGLCSTGAGSSSRAGGLVFRSPHPRTNNQASARRMLVEQYHDRKGRQGPNSGRSRRVLLMKVPCYARRCRMDKIVVEGGARLVGKIPISGAK